MLQRMEIGERIRRHREFMGLTRDQFSEILNVSTKFCSDIELGQKGFSLDTLCKISAALKVSTDYILFGKTELNEELDGTLNIIYSCDSSKIPFLYEIVKNFVLACDSDNIM